MSAYNFIHNRGKNTSLFSFSKPQAQNRIIFLLKTFYHHIFSQKQNKYIKNISIITHSSHTAPVAGSKEKRSKKKARRGEAPLLVLNRPQVLPVPLTLRTYAG